MGPRREGLFVINFTPSPKGLLRFCLSRKEIPRGCPGGQLTGKQMISAQWSIMKLKNSGYGVIQAIKIKRGRWLANSVNIQSTK